MGLKIRKPSGLTYEEKMVVVVVVVVLRSGKE